jgi:Putative peptidoglycan binding domain
MTLIPILVVGCGAVPDASRPPIPAIAEPAPPPLDAAPASNSPASTSTQVASAATTTTPTTASTPDSALLGWANTVGGFFVEDACRDLAPLPLHDCYSTANVSDLGTIYVVIPLPLGAPYFALVTETNGEYGVSDSFSEWSGVARPAWMADVVTGGAEYFSPYEAVLRTLWSEGVSYQGPCPESDLGFGKICSEFFRDVDGTVIVRIFDLDHPHLEDWRIQYVPDRDRYVVVARAVNNTGAAGGPPTTASVSTSVAPLGPLPSVGWDGTYGPEPESGPLRIGDKGPRVVALQQALGFAELLDPPYDGFFGPATERAVVAIEQGAGLPVDGIAGDAVLQALQPD